MNCANWYEAFAFCIWDGGRLPTEAEWEYAAAGGDQNRLFPWGSDVAEPLPAAYNRTENRIVAVGSYPDGNGRWGHADLAGNLWEWTLDSCDDYTTDSCLDCANLSPSDCRVGRGGDGHTFADGLRAAKRSGYLASYYRYPDIGIRCARSAP